MKIYNKIIMKWNEETQQFDDVYEDSYDYYGDIDYLSLMKGYLPNITGNNKNINNSYKILNNITEAHIV